jgi:flagellar secretion chaperone FliS
MLTNGYRAAYLESKVLSASPLELIHLAYDGAIEAVGAARIHLRDKNIHERSKSITKAQLLVQELKRSLDFENGGPISVQLGQLYDYMYGRLQEANFRQAEEPLNEVETLLGTLDEAWREIAAAENPVMQSSVASASWMNGSDTSVYSRAEFTF